MPVLSGKALEGFFRVQDNGLITDARARYADEVRREEAKAKTAQAAGNAAVEAETNAVTSVEEVQGEVARLAGQTIVGAEVQQEEASTLSAFPIGLVDTSVR